MAPHSKITILEITQTCIVLCMHVNASICCQQLKAY